MAHFKKITMQEKKQRGGSGRNQGNKPKKFSEDLKYKTVLIPISKRKMFAELAKIERKKVQISVSSGENMVSSENN